MQRKYLNIIILILLTLIIYANTLNNDFVWDDISLVKKNACIKNLKFIPKIFSSDIFQDAGRTNIVYYRPLQLLSFMADYAIWGTNPAGYHLTNVLLHITNTVLVYFLIAFLLGDGIFSLLAAGLFAAHPLHTEAVTYISGRADPLMTMFLLLVSLAYLKYINCLAREKIYFYYPLGIAFFTLALLCKEAAILFPLTLISCRFIIKKNNAEIKYAVLPFFIVTLFYCWIRSIGLKQESEIVKDLIAPLSIRMLSVPETILEYLKFLFLPLNLHMERKINLSAWAFEPNFLIASLLLILLILTIIKFRRQWRIPLFGLSWFFLNLLAVLNLFPLNAPIAEHWLYLPSIGFFIVLAAAASRAAELKINLIMRAWLKRALVSILTLVLAVLSAITIKQNTYWKDELILYKRILELNPKSGRAHVNLGIAYMKEGLTKEAMEELKEGLSLAPKSDVAHKAIGNLYFRNKRYDEAMQAYKKAAELSPHRSGNYANMGAIFYEMGFYDEAIKEFNKAGWLNPYDSDIYNNLGLSYLKKGQNDKAMIEFKKASELDPDNIAARRNLIEYYENAGELTKASKEYKKLLRQEPADEHTRNKLIAFYEDNKNYGLAIKEYKGLLRLNPSNIALKNKLAIAYDKNGMYKEALELFNRTLKNNLDSYETHNNLGIFYAKHGQFAKAKQEWEKALLLNPSYEEAAKNLLRLRQKGY